MDNVMFHNLNDVYAAGGMDFAESDSLKTLGAIGGVVEEGRALIDIIKLCAHIIRGESDPPLLATSMAGTLDFKNNVLSCQLSSGAAELGKSSEVDFAKAIFCPLKFGVQGLDALRAVPNMLDRLPARNLFEDSSIHETVVENVMLTGRGLLRPGDRELVRATVEE